MVSKAASLAALSFLVLLPVSSALMVLEDASGDVAQATPSPLHADNIDLRSLEVTEDEDAFHFVLDAGAPPEPSIVGLDSKEYEVQFRHEDVWFTLELDHVYPLAAPQEGVYRAELYRELEEGSYDFVAELEPTATGSMFEVSVPRALLVDSQGTPPAIGRSLEDFYVEAESWDLETIRIDGTGIGIIQFTDRMPDDGTGDVPFATQVGLHQDGDGLLHAATPLRFSNGEATAFVYDVEARNEGDVPHTFSFSIQDAPDGWVVIPPPLLELDAGASETVKVVAHVPFQHQHGTTALFLMSMVGIDDPGSVGRVELGVHYPEIPQPTGHHNELFIHTRVAAEETVLPKEAMELLRARGVQVATMNTVADDPADEQVSVPGFSDTIDFTDDNEVVAVYGWRISLSPGLRMGLSTDTATEGTLDIRLETATQMDAWISGELWVGSAHDDPYSPDSFGDEDRTVVARLVGERTPAGTGFSATVVPEDMDVPFEATNQLFMELWLNVVGVDPLLGTPLTPRLVDGHVIVPLQEYHDSLEVPVTLADLQLIEETGPVVPAAESEVEESPGFVAVLALIACVAAAWLRRSP